MERCHHLSGDDEGDKFRDEGNEKEGMNNKIHVSVNCLFFVLMLCKWEKGALSVS